MNILSKYFMHKNCDQGTFDTSTFMHSPLIVTLLVVLSFAILLSIEFVKKIFKRRMVSFGITRCKLLP